jgi:hypothetical protein
MQCQLGVSALQVFIADIRNCQNKEQEKTRVDKELGKIRKKFASGNAITGALLLLTVRCKSCNCSCWSERACLRRV